MKTRILFLSYQSSRNGAPRALYSFIKHLDRGMFEAHVVFNRNGAIVPEFRRYASTTVLGSIRLPRRGGLRHVHRLVTRSVHRAKLNRLLDSFRPDLVYINTVSPSEAAAWALDIPGIPIVVHSHEIDATVVVNTPANWVDRLVKRADLFIGCSRAVSDFIERCLGVDKEKILTFPSSVDVADLLSRTLKPREEVRRLLGVPEDAILIGAVGYPNFRKGVDLFIEAAAAICDARPRWNIHFVWLGGRRELHREPYMRIMRSLVERLGLADRFHWVEELADPFSHTAAMTVQVSTAREEPLGLTIVESMLLGTPVIAYAVGGIPELLSDGRGVLVDRILPEDLAAAVVKFLETPGCWYDCRSRARARVLARYDISANVRPVARALALLAAYRQSAGRGIYEHEEASRWKDRRPALTPASTRGEKRDSAPAAHSVL